MIFSTILCCVQVYKFIKTIFQESNILNLEGVSSRTSKGITRAPHSRKFITRHIGE